MVGTDALSFAIFANSFQASAEVNNIDSLTAAISAGVLYIKIAPGTYTMPSTTLALPSGCVLEGSGIDSTVLLNADTGTDFILSMTTDCIVRDLTIDVGGLTSRRGITTSSNNIIIESVRLTNSNNATRIEINSVNTRIIDCCFDTDPGAGSGGFYINILGNFVRITNCTFADNLTGQMYISECRFDTLITNCHFNGGSGEGINFSTVADNMSIINCVFEDMVQDAIEVVSPRLIIKGCILDNNAICHVITSILIDSNILVSGSSTTIFDIDLFLVITTGFIVANNLFLPNISATKLITYFQFFADRLGIMTRNTFVDESTNSVLDTPYDYGPVNSLYITTTSNNNRIINQLDVASSPYASVWELNGCEFTITGGAVTIDFTGSVGTASTISNVGHVMIIERATGSAANLIVDSREFSGAGLVTTTFDTDGDQMVLFDTGSFGAVVFATNGTV